MAKKDHPASDREVLARNRKASHEYLLIERFEAGIVLSGPEVKSARAGRVNLKEGYARVQNGELYLIGVHFSPYANARLDSIDPVRTRKLLLHARELRKIDKELQGTGTTLVPTLLYLTRGRIKVEIALAKGKKLHDKRETAKRRIAQREMDREERGR